MTHGGKRTGAGRPVGAIGTRSKEIASKLKELDCDPIEALAMIAKDQTNTPELRFQANKELAQYVAPKRKAVEMDAALDGGLNINIQKFNLESETDGYGGTDPD